MTEAEEIVLNDAERQRCEVWTRVMGYFRPVSEFNIGKKSEYAERVYFSEKKAMGKIEDDKRAREIDILARTIYGEARGESVLGKKAIACVVMNRQRARRWFTGETVADTCLFCANGSKWHQFSCWNADDPNGEFIAAATDAELAPYVEIAKEAVDGKLLDFLAGATHYHAIGTRPAWAEGKQPSFKIGRHYFYNGVD